MSHQAVILKDKGARLVLETVPIPKPGPSEVLIKVHAIATNPVDYKMQDGGVFIGGYPIILGSDIAGTIDAVGSAISGFKEGDRVVGYADALLSGDLRNGAFQQHVVVKESCVAKLPASISFEEGAIVPMSVATAGVGFFLDLGVPRPPTKQSGGFLVWAASSSVGSGVVQLANLAGYRVYAVCSTRHHDYIKKLGASACFDYKDPNVIKAIVETAKSDGYEIKIGYDAFSEAGSSPLAAQVLETFGGGRLCTTQPFPEGEKPANVEAPGSFAMRVAGDAKEFGTWLFGEWLSAALADGSYVPSPGIEMVSGGLDAVQGAIDLHKKGMSGKKPVLTI